jgi:hypothetical protein
MKSALLQHDRMIMMGKMVYIRNALEVAALTIFASSLATSGIGGLSWGY